MTDNHNGYYCLKLKIVQQKLSEFVLNAIVTLTKLETFELKKKKYDKKLKPAIN